MLSQLGFGAMGMVLVAYDPELDRRIALKLLKPVGSDRSAAQARLQREAQALARLNHPNVVAVHDVGIHKGQVFVAMELVDGQTLEQWMRSTKDGEPRPWAEVVRLFQAVGRGLAAAHAVGLVHRDIKPSNVMVGDDGRVRLMDFGLARIDESAPSSGDIPDDLDTDQRKALEASLTRTGALLGTPAYMAPEQFGGQVTPLSDQFAFCVTLYEALFGGRPFQGTTPAQLVYAMAQGKLSAPTRGRSVPSWLRKIVLRGLSARPEDRFERISDLLAALGQGDARRRRARWSIAMAVPVAAAGVGLVYQQYDHEQRVIACAARGDAIEEIWNPGSRHDLYEGMVETGVSYASSVAQRSVDRLDAQASSWREHAIAACTHHAVHQTWDTVDHDRAQWCLEERRLALQTVVEELTAVDERTLYRAIEVIANLPPASMCVDEESLTTMGSPPPLALRPQVAQAREQLAQAEYLRWVGRYDEGLEFIDRALERSESLSWPPLVANLHATRASLLGLTGAYAEAEAEGRAAYMQAARSGAWDVAAEAASQLVDSVGHQQERYAEGEAWAEHAAVAIAHAGDPLGLREATRLNVLGALSGARGDHAKEIQYFERALSLRELALQDDHPTRAMSLNNLGSAYAKAGRYELAQARLEQALAIYEEALGSDHPKVANGLNNLGGVYQAQGDYVRAVEMLERALAIRTRVSGPDHPEVAGVLLNVAIAQMRTTEYSQARVRLERVVAIREQTLGADHPQVAAALTSLGLALMRVGALDEAEAKLLRAVAILEQARGSDHSRLVWSINNLGRVYEAGGEHAKAREQFERALAIGERGFRPDHPKLAVSLIDLGRVLMVQGEYALAIETLARAVPISAGDRVTPRLRVKALFALARARWDAPVSEGRDRGRALQLARQAREIDVKHDQEGAEVLAQVEHWLEAHEREAARARAGAGEISENPMIP